MKSIENRNRVQATDFRAENIKIRELLHKKSKEC